ncbi:threonine-phosphate decarboxylase CobD [Paenactinomyces guangxiensis]|uniref:threonine-phosphate decarboxylase n=1 Tax=Paenactinomyces guangxiensis TaxID=1490290 RepID=A0A7W2A6R2_9BACL|nr:threonine-phosphate decarboxylase CobD [Paenactinomyces guangxiensis]MBA4492800.1 threonine-phosphate decarboxylase [Paenactinomyces guangxiensis]MBH8590351.1 threonine-phosphate decarboxylase [Paenactinomyces guangxiensis]
MGRLERYGHGGDIVTAAEIFAVNGREWIDFSSNIYPYGPPGTVVERLRECLSEPGWTALTRYPDPESRKLKHQIATFHGIDADQVLVGNGAAELIDLLLSVLGPERVGVIEPAFAEYSAAAKKRKMAVTSLITKWEKKFQPSLEEAIQLINQTGLVFVGIPNNPTGHSLSFSFLEEMAAAAVRSGTWLVMDEAFIDFLPDGENRSFIHQIRRFPTTIVVRSMTKFYALPGLRLGYVVAASSVIRQLKRMQTPWSVNSLAQVAGCTVLDQQVNQAFAQQVHNWLREEKAQLKADLERLTWLEVFPGEANYLLLRIQTKKAFLSASQLQEELGKRGLLIRDCSMYQGLDERYFRIAVKTRSQNQTLISALTEVSACLERKE